MTDDSTGPTPGFARSSMMRTGLGVVAVVSGLTGAQLIDLGTRTGITGGILLLVVALGLGAVAVGGRAYGPGVEGPLDLSARIGLGLLGGVMAGLFHGVLTEITGSVGLTLLLGVGVDVDLSAAEWVLRIVNGGLWGFALGVFYPWIPGASFAGKGALFSLLPTVYTLFVVYPVFLGLGLLGVRQGLLTFPLVLIGYLVGGVVAAWVISWGERTDVAPVSDPLAG